MNDSLFVRPAVFHVPRALRDGLVSVIRTDLIAPAVTLSLPPSGWSAGMSEPARVAAAVRAERARRYFRQYGQSVVNWF